MLNPLLGTTEEVGQQLRCNTWAVGGTVGGETGGTTVTLLGWETRKMTKEVAVMLGELEKYSV